MKIERLAYVGLSVDDPQAWFRFAREGLGLADAGTSGDTLRLQMDNQSWRIALHKGPSNDLAYLGFEVDESAALDEVEAALRQRDIGCRRLTPAQLDARCVRDGIAFKDPDGLDVEVVLGHAAAARPFASSLVRGFVTDEQGLGHVVLSINDPERAVEFYRSLGFKLSDLIEATLGPDLAVTISFLHCNPRHHTLAFVRLPLPRRLEHLMLEVASVDELIEAYNRMRHLGYAIRRHLGRHPNDRMLSFYVTTPSGFDVEIGWDGQQVASDWVVRTYDRVSLWGHESS